MTRKRTVITVQNGSDFVHSLDFRSSAWSWSDISLFLFPFTAWSLRDVSVCLSEVLCLSEGFSPSRCSKLVPEVVLSGWVVTGTRSSPQKRRIKDQ